MIDPCAMPYQPQKVGPVNALIWIAPGLVLLALSGAGCFPMEGLARVVSADGALNADYESLLRASQWTLAFLLLALRPIVWICCRAWRGLTAVLETSPIRFCVAAAAVAFMVAGTVHIFLWQGIPHVTDEISHLFQAKILSLGRFHAPAPPCFAQFGQEHIYITQGGRWFSIYPPGHALLLAGFLKLATPALVVPLCFALSAVAFFWIAAFFFDGLTARVATIFYVASPLNLLLGGSYMSHMSFLAFFLVGAALLLVSLNRRSHGFSLIILRCTAGFFLGYSALIRPQDFAILGAVAALAFLVSPRAHKMPAFLAACAALPGALIPLAFQLAWNHVQYGSAWSAGYARADVQPLTHMLVPRFGFSESHTMAQAAAVTGWTLLRMNKVLLGWPSSFLLIPFAFAPGRWDRRDLVCLVGLLLPAAFYFFYFYHGIEYEARLFHVAVPFALVLTIRGLLNVSRWWDDASRKGFKITQGISGALAACAIVTVFFLHSAFYYVPRYLWPRYSSNYEGASPDLGRLVQRNKLQNALVLIPTQGDQDLRYSSGFMLNDPLLRGPVIYARDFGQGDDCLREAFPDRAFYVYRPVENGGSSLQPLD